MYDIIPDIHGQYEKLEAALTGLGYRRKGGAWRHSSPARTCVFLGDFIDRGPRNGDVITLVREMLEAGTAMAVMGNHELNAIHFHSRHPDTGAPLRARSPKNTGQHQSFLGEFPLDNARTEEIIGWMRRLPLYLELDGFRAVHACWDEGRMAQLEANTTAGVLSEDQFIKAAEPDHLLNDLVDTITKGPEAPLPHGHSFADKNGDRRSNVRVKWWNAEGQSWAEIAMSVPEPENLPKGALPPDVKATAYPATANPVFFGHYWMTGQPVLQAANALCLDYSAGKEGPLMAYTMEDGQLLSLNNLRAFGR